MRLLTKYFQGIAHDLKGVNQNYNVKFASLCLREGLKKIKKRITGNSTFQRWGQ